MIARWYTQNLTPITGIITLMTSLIEMLFICMCVKKILFTQILLDFASFLKWYWLKYKTFPSQYMVLKYIQIYWSPGRLPSWLECSWCLLKHSSVIDYGAIWSAPDGSHMTELNVRHKWNQWISSRNWLMYHVTR